MKKANFIILFIILALNLFATDSILRTDQAVIVNRSQYMPVKSNFGFVNWQEYETENFAVIFSPGLDSLAVQTGLAAERCYATLQDSLKSKFAGKYKIFLSDLPATGQGITSTYPYGFSIIHTNTLSAQNGSVTQSDLLRLCVKEKIVQAINFENSKNRLNNLLVYPGFARDLAKNLRKNQTAELSSFDKSNREESFSSNKTESDCGRFRASDEFQGHEGVFKGSYNSLQAIKPLLVLPFPYPHKDEKITGGIVSIWSDPLFTHQLGMAAAYNIAEPAKPQYSFGYVNRQTLLDISLFTADLEIFQLDYAEKIMYQNNHYTIFSVGMPFKSAYSVNARHYLTAGYTNQQKKILNHNDFLPENNKLIENGKFVQPVDYRSANIFMDYSWRYLEPYSKKGLNPVNGFGFHLKYGYESKELLSDFHNHTLNSEFFLLYPLGEKAGFATNVSLYLFSGFRMVEGELPAQNRAGLDRYNTTTVGGLLPMVVDETKRYFVRGNRNFYQGNRLLSTTAEIYLPLTGKSGLGLNSFKIMQFGISGFIDYGTIWQNDFFDSNDLKDAASSGLEVKTTHSDFDELELYGGVAKNLLDGKDNARFYTGLRLILPF